MQFALLVFYISTRAIGCAVFYESLPNLSILATDDTISCFVTLDARYDQYHLKRITFTLKIYWIPEAVDDLPEVFCVVDDILISGENIQEYNKRFNCFL